ncbi:MAG: GIY-YIG nuclease family protein [Candidatus Paceibacterota bacterium]
MQYVYVLKSLKDDTLYTGCSSDLQQRIKLHNAGRVATTNKKFPYELLYYEAYKNKADAFTREKYLKTGWGRNYIKKVLSNTLRTQKN